MFIQSESVPGQLPELLDDMPWVWLIMELPYFMMVNKDNPPVVFKAKERFFRVWGAATTLEERKETLQVFRKYIGHKEV